MSEYPGIEAPAVMPPGDAPAAGPLPADAYDGPGPGGGIFLAAEPERERESEREFVPPGDTEPPPLLPPPLLPRLLEAGAYSLYLRPDGKLHLTWQRTALGDESGGIAALPDAEIETRHSRDFPDRMGGLAYLLLLDRATPLPPQAEAMMAMLDGSGPPSRAAMLKMAAGLPAMLGAMAAGEPEQ